MRRVESGLFSSVALAILIGFALACGGGGGGEGDGIGTGTTAGGGACISCHEDFSWSAQIVADFLAGKHVVHSSHITAADAPDGCLACHDPKSDGPDIEQYIAAADIPAGGLAAVGCENCHGDGGEHYGAGPIPVARPGAAECGACHDALPSGSHITYHPEADNIYTDYAASKHAESGDRNEVKCVKCHTDEGGRAYKAVETAEMLAAVTLPLDTASPIQCRTCHDPHKPTELLKEEETSGHGSSETVVASAQYATCTNCHQAHDAKLAAFTDPTDPADPTDAAYVAYEALLDDPLGDIAGDATGTDDAAAGGLIYHAKRWNRVISTTHHDNPATSYESHKADAAVPNLVEGYIMDPTNEHVCLDCHNVHAADTTINEQWARSGHGGEILTAKEAAETAQAANRRTYTEIRAIRDAGADDGNAWPHYDWDASNRQSCQMCHSATGAKNQLDSIITKNTDPDNYVEYDPVNNDFSYLIGWTATVSSGQNELLYCWACHKNNSGAVRESGAITLASYTYDADRDPATDNAVDVVLPDVGNSNVCLNCHAGRGNVTSVLTASRSKRAKAHHGAAAGTLFSATTHSGHEYAGADYANKSYFKHDGIGTADADGNEVYEGTGTTSGPCAACHMPSSNHTFKVVEETAGVITSITNQALCDACHSTHGLMTAAVVEEEKEGFVNALLLLENYLKNVPVNYLNLDIHTTDNNNYKTVAMEAYGAFQNYKYLGDEPGAYAHNRYYAKRLIFDSIDWLDNGALDGTIDLTGYADAHVWYDEDDPIGAVTRP